MKQLFCVLLGVSCFCLLIGCGNGAFLVRPIPSEYSLEETVIRKDHAWWVKDKIVVIDVDGVIMNQTVSSFMQSGNNPVGVFCEKLDRAAADKHVKGVVLRINSPGGGVTATELMYHRLMAFKKKKRVPVVVSMLDVAASGGYYLACGGDKIYATPSTLTGSIGTIMQTFSLENTLGFIGIKPYVIKSGKMKDMASPFHDMRDDERKVLQGIIDSSYQQFFDVVATRRGIEAEDLKPLADGRVYQGKLALEHHLVDAIGFPEDAIEEVRRRAQIKTCKVVMYHYPYQRVAGVYSTAESQVPVSSSGIHIQLPDWLRCDTPQLLYMWKP